MSHMANRGVRIIFAQLPVPLVNLLSTLPSPCHSPYITSIMRPFCSLNEENMLDKSVGLIDIQTELFTNLTNQEKDTVYLSILLKRVALVSVPRMKSQLEQSTMDGRAVISKALTNFIDPAERTGECLETFAAGIHNGLMT
jgi:hypothetical protein